MKVSVEKNEYQTNVFSDDETLSGAVVWKNKGWIIQIIDNESGGISSRHEDNPISDHWSAISQLIKWMFEYKAR